MDATNNNTIITLTDEDVQEAILNYIFKRNPGLRPLGTKSEKSPQIIMSLKDASIKAIVLLPSDEEVCDDKK